MVSGRSRKRRKLLWRKFLTLVTWFQSISQFSRVEFDAISIVFCIPAPTDSKKTFAVPSCQGIDAMPWRTQNVNMPWRVPDVAFPCISRSRKMSIGCSLQNPTTFTTLTMLLFSQSHFWHVDKLSSGHTDIVPVGGIADWLHNMMVVIRCRTPTSPNRNGKIPSDVAKR